MVPTFATVSLLLTYTRVEEFTILYTIIKLRPLPSASAEEITCVGQD